jgi:hypothetical protein
MFAKKSQMIKNIKSTLEANGVEVNDQAAENVLKMVEIFMEPKLRPLSSKEVDDHILVKQAPKDMRDEIKDYVRSLDYEHKREFVPEDA